MIDARSPKGESPESWARSRRYAVLRDLVGAQEILLTAHHKDDQAETLLLQLFRGAGPDGLSAMPVRQIFGKGWHCRPLLEFTRRQLQNYAGENQLGWVEDESNQDAGIDRNYIRLQLLPAIIKQWPGGLETLSRAAKHQAEASALLGHTAEQDLASINVGAPGITLSIAKLKELPLPRQKNLLRCWLQQLQLPVPDAANIEHIISDVVNSRQQAMPCVSWHGAEVRRYRGYIYAASPLGEHDSEKIVSWDLERRLSVAYGSLKARRGTGNGIRADLCPNNRVEIRYRHGGETIQPAGRTYHHALKKLLQENAVLPWLRNRIPLLYVDGKFAAVPGMWIDAGFVGSDTEECWQLEWEGIDEIFGVCGGS